MRLVFVPTESRPAAFVCIGLRLVELGDLRCLVSFDFQVTIFTY